MIKKVIEKKVVDFEKLVAYCDVCEVEQPEGTALIVVHAYLVTKNANFFGDETGSAHMSVCGDCLANNSKAVKLVMDSKTFPQLRTSYAAHQAKYAGSEKMAAPSGYGYSIPVSTSTYTVATPTLRIP